MPRTREQVLQSLDIERQYQNKRGFKKRSIAEEILVCQFYLDLARNSYVERQTQSPAGAIDQTLCLRHLRRAAANVVRCLEKHQVADDQVEQYGVLGKKVPK